MSALTKILDNTDSRTSLIRKNILFSFLIKGWSAFVMLLLVPITLRCLGEYTNGVWLTISSMLIWIDQMDIGLSNGLRNQLAAALAQDDCEKARRVVSSTFFMLLIIIVPILLVLCSLIFFCDINEFLNIDSTKSGDLTDVVLVTTIIICATFVFKFIGSFYMGMQLPAVSNLFLTIGHTITLAFTYIAFYSGYHSLMVIAVINTASPLLVYLLSYPYAFFYKYRFLAPSFQYFTLSDARSLFTIGVQFFVLQMAGVVLFMSSNLVISKLFSPAEVTPYQIAYRYFTLCLILFNIISTPYWSATTDAYERGDLEWIRCSRRKMRNIMLWITVIISIMVTVSPIVYRIWLHTLTEIPFMLTVLVALYILVLIYSMSYSNFIFGIGKLRIQLLFTLGAAIMFIPVTLLLLSYEHSFYAIVGAMVLVNLPGLFANKIQLGKLLRGGATGIWIK